MIHVSASESTGRGRSPTWLLQWLRPPVWCRLKDNTRFRKMSGSCSVGSEGRPSSTTPRRNSTKSAFKCSESIEGWWRGGSPIRPHLRISSLLQFTYHSGDMAPALPSRRSWSAPELCNTSSGALREGQAGNKSLCLASGDERRGRGGEM